MLGFRPDGMARPVAIVFAIARFLDDNYVSHTDRERLRAALRSAGREMEETPGDTTVSIITLLFGLALLVGVFRVAEWFGPYDENTDPLKYWISAIVPLMGVLGCVVLILVSIAAIAKTGLGHFLRMSSDPKKTPFAYGAAAIGIVISIMKWIDR
jgi:hypothetical protein